MLLIRTRGERTIDIRPEWWACFLSWGTPVEQWLQKARAIVNGLEVFAQTSPEATAFVGLFIGWTTDVHGVAACVVIPDYMTDEDVEQMRRQLVAHFDANPPNGVELAQAAA